LRISWTFHAKCWIFCAKRWKWFTEPVCVAWVVCHSRISGNLKKERLWLVAQPGWAWQ